MRTRVQRAYALQGGCVERVLAASTGEVFVPDAGAWMQPAAGVELVPVPGVYERWCDVPAAWLGGCPYFR